MILRLCGRLGSRVRLGLEVAFEFIEEEGLGTPLPWSVRIRQGGVAIWGGNEQMVCYASKSKRHLEDMELIVRLVNASKDEE